MLQEVTFVTSPITKRFLGSVVRRFGIQIRWISRSYQTTSPNTLTRTSQLINNVLNTLEYRINLLGLKPIKNFRTSPRSVNELDTFSKGIYRKITREI